MPLGATGEVEVCALEDAAWAAPPEQGVHEHPLTAFVQSIRRGRPGEDARLGADRLKLVPFDPGDLDDYAWPDPAARAALAGPPGTVKHGWALVWTTGATPIALILAAPAGSGFGAVRDALKGRPAPRIIHLMPGLPSEELGDPSMPAP